MLNIDNYVAEFSKSFGKLIGDDISKHVSFRKKQTDFLAKLSANIALMRLAGFGNQNGFDDQAEMDLWIDNLKRTSRNFVRTVTSLTIITLEKAWNAIVGGLWGIINKILSPIGINLSIPNARI